MPFATSIVPMPHWSTPLGCTKLFLTIVVLAFISACTAIWGWYPAFSHTLFTATLSLLTFGYYTAALSFKPALYNKWLVLSLETALTLLWFGSLIFLSGWTGASTAIPRYYYTLDPYPATPYDYPNIYDKSDDGLSSRSLDRSELLSHSWELFGLARRQVTDGRVPSTLVRVHGSDAHYAAQILAGISAGLAGMIFIMYAITLTTFTMNFYSNTHASTPGRPANSRFTPPNDEEMQMQPRPQPSHSNTTNTDVNTLTVPSLPPRPHSIQPQVPSTTPPSLTQPLNISSLPRDFDSTSVSKPETEPQRQVAESESESGYFLSPHEATNAGIRPPTPVVRALEKEREKIDREGEGEMKSGDEHERGRKGYVTRDDGRVEREV